MSGYYVMHCIDGDECLIAHVQTLDEARQRWADERRQSQYCADISIWEAGGRILALTKLDGSLHWVQP